MKKKEKTWGEKCLEKHEKLLKSWTGQNGNLIIPGWVGV